MDMEKNGEYLVFDDLKILYQRIIKLVEKIDNEN